MLIKHKDRANSSKKPYLIEGDNVIATDSRVKYKMAYVGKFIDWKIKNTYQGSGNYYYPMMFHKILFANRYY